jgi:hypothetical protein
MSLEGAAVLAAFAVINLAFGLYARREGAGASLNPETIGEAAGMTMRLAGVLFPVLAAGFGIAAVVNLIGAVL